MRKGGWKRRLVWGLLVLALLGAVLGVTWRAWTLPVARWVLATCGVHVKSLAWMGPDSIKAENIDIQKPGAQIHIVSLTALTPWVWKRSLQRLNTNDPPVYFMIDGWKAVMRKAETPEPKPARAISSLIHSLQEGLDALQTNCPSAVILNGVLQTEQGEFGFNKIQFQKGELSGSFTWPGLNDPADFRVSRSQVILKQLALEIGSKIAIENVQDDVRLKGYARWMTNRVDLDLTFSPQENIPRAGFVRSKGLALPGRLIGAPEIERLAAGVSLVFTNGQFKLSLSEVAENASSAEASLKPFPEAASGPN